ncbi:MAG TPA: hypothetical protein VK575_00350 [Gemmatimonadaceae bacterium]|jgi:hypothetical protein|nr:hypothetical protein [Gemmatimonadaceae bacterium]
MADNSQASQQQAALNEANEKAAERAKQAKATAEKAVDARAEVMAKQNAAYYEQEAAAQPTPTQRENDLAKVGALNIDEKEDDGSEWDDEHQRRVATERLNNPYDVATAEATAGSAESTEEGRTRRTRRSK